MPISFDHMQFLGNSLAEIAKAKAGIIKAGRPTIVAHQPPEAAAVIEKRAAQLGAPLWRCGAEWNFAIGGDGFTYRDAHGALDLPKPVVLPGRHQFGNAAAAVAATRFLDGFAPVGESHRRRHRRRRLARAHAAPHARPAGRSSAAASWELWLDGGHNEDAGLIIADMIEEWQQAGAQAGQPHLRHADQQGSARLPAPPRAGRAGSFRRRHPRRSFLDRGGRRRRLRAPGRPAGRGPCLDQGSARPPSSRAMGPRRAASSSAARSIWRARFWRITVE